jgi:hypothetical protein
VLEKDGEISWTDQVRNEDLLRQGRQEYSKNKRRKTTWFGHVLRRNCLLKRVTEREVWKNCKRWRQQKIVILLNFQLLNQNYETRQDELQQYSLILL